MSSELAAKRDRERKIERVLRDYFRSGFFRIDEESGEAFIFVRTSVGHRSELLNLSRLAEELADKI